MMKDPTGYLRRLLRPDLLLAALAIAAGISGAALAGHYLKTRATAKEVELQQHYATRAAIVAASDLQKGEILAPAKLAIRQIPGDFIPVDALPADRAGELIGAQLAIDVRRGTPVVQAALQERVLVARLANLLAPDERALTIAVDEMSSQAGGLRVGDRVDLFHLRSVSGDAVLVPLLQYVEILGVGSSLGNDRNQSDPAAAQPRYATVTLRIAASEAPRLLLAQQAGEVVAALRSPGDTALQELRIRRGQELLRSTAIAGEAVNQGVEVLVGGGGELTPSRSWLHPGKPASAGGAT